MCGWLLFYIVITINIYRYSDDVRFIDTYHIQEKDDCSIKWLDSMECSGYLCDDMHLKCRLYLNTSDFGCIQ